MENNAFFILIGIAATIYGIYGLRNRKLKYYYTLFSFFDNKSPETGKNAVLLAYLHIVVGIGLIILASMIIYVNR